MKTKLNHEQIKSLGALGLSEIQAILYLTSLQGGILSVLELSKLTGINRQQIYQEAEKLIKLGLYETTSKSKRKYIAANPRKLARLADENIATAEAAAYRVTNLIPELEAQLSSKKNKVVTKYYEGLDKIKEAYNDELEASKNTEVLSFAGSIDNTFKFLSESYWDRWNKKFARHESKSRMLVHFSETARKTAINDREYKRETRHIEEFPLKANIDVFNNTVLIVSFEEEIASWIDSPILAKSYRIIFEALWHQAKSF